VAFGVLPQVPGANPASGDVCRLPLSIEAATPHVQGIAVLPGCGWRPMKAAGGPPTMACHVKVWARRVYKPRVHIKVEADSATSSSRPVLLSSLA